jgi:hypothetical protein
MPYKRPLSDDHRRRLREACRRFYASKPNSTRDIQLKNKLGIPHGTYDRMYVECGGFCGVCRRKHPLNGVGKECLYVDHDHSTGVVRGLICFYCNTALGLLRDDILVMENAIAYVKKFKTVV